MPIPKKESKIKYGNSFETQRVEIEDINPCDETHKMPNGGEISFPYRIRIVDSEGDIISDNRTTKQTFVEDWKNGSHFYTNPKGYMTFSRDRDLLAIVTILKKKNYKALRDVEAGDEFDINDLIGAKFDAVLADVETGRFIDWTRTFMANDIEVPRSERVAATVDPDEVDIDEDDEEDEKPTKSSKRIFDEDEDEDEDEEPVSKKGKSVKKQEEDEEDADEDDEEDEKPTKKIKKNR